jgi:hypothetical protein
MSKIEREKSVFIVNRVLIVLAFAAILMGLYYDEWKIVLNNARTLCLSCIGIE